MKIVIASGGTGGHILPSLNLAEYLRAEYSAEVYFIGTLKKYTDVIFSRGFEDVPLDAVGLETSSLLKICVWFWKMLVATVVALRALVRLKPQAVIGFGGYSSFPVVLSAWLLRIPAVIHEQNVIPGKANRWLTPFVRKIAISFSESQKYFPVKKVVLTGYPLRNLQGRVSKKDFFRQNGLEEGRFTILICGGSQGSRALNTTFVQGAQRLNQELPFQVIHLAGGEADCEMIREAYKKIGIPHVVFPYYDQMGDLYGCADLVISRAGAGTIHELLVLNASAILVPYPFAGGHQKANAAVLTGTGRGIMIEEKHLTSDHLRVQILELARAAQTRARLDVNWIEIAKISQQRLAETVLGVI